jgi:2-dehydro-3-deoxy-D-pentonate aldolase
MTNDKRFRGVVPPLVTPFTADGLLDESGARRIIDFLINGGVDGIFILGTTGESASVPRAERNRFVEATVQETAGRVPVYVGIGDNSFAGSLESAGHAFGAGADAVVAHLPSYYPLNAAEMTAYFTRLADELAGPLVLYNIPSTTHMSLPVEVVARLSEHPRVAGFKDSENSPGRLEEMTSRLVGKPDFSVFMGAAVLSSKALAAGADGVVPASGNLCPESWRDMMAAASRGDWQSAEDLQCVVNRVAQLFQKGRTLAQSLAALKAAMCALGLCRPHMLPPLQELTPEGIESVRQELLSLGFACAQETVTAPAEPV